MKRDIKNATNDTNYVKSYACKGEFPCRPCMHKREKETREDKDFFLSLKASMQY